MDYFVNDQDVGDGAIVQADTPTDAAQRFIDIVHKSLPGRAVDPWQLNIFPINRREALIAPLDLHDL